MLQQSTQLPFEGVWHVEHATLPDGSFAYTGVITAQKTGDTYSLSWDISAGHYVGLGLVRGEHLFVSCGETFNQLGIALYYLDNNGALAGQWSEPELNGAPGQARFTTPWSGSFEGQHQVSHQHPQTSEATLWEISIRSRDDIYEVAWRQPNGLERTGLGITMENGIAVGWYPDLKQLAFLDYSFADQKANTLMATWALGGYTTLGTERLTRT